MILTIHQPEHIPWLGFFHKVSMADVFVILDSVQFRKNYFQNRNKIRTADGWSWVTVPVSYEFGDLIKDVTVVPEQKWKKKWHHTIYFSYKKAPFFNDYSKQLFDVINKDWDCISDLNICLIGLLCGFLGIEANFVKASDLQLRGQSSNLILEICRKLQADCYVSGISGRDYLKEEDFRREGIEILYQEFHHPIYDQLHEPFEPCMSVIDLVFNHGPKSLEIIRGKDVPVMENLFL